MRYEQPLFRPPSEAYSLIVQVTIGCSHNACGFCSMYQGKRFRVRSVDEILADIAEAKGRYVDKIFLADGDALAMPTDELLLVLAALRGAYPQVERISLYAGPKNVLEKSEEELRAIREAGVSLAYFGMESGDEQVLREISKGATPDELAQAGRKIQAAGIDLSVTVILGLAGKDRWREHALATAALASRVNPKYLAALTLMVDEKTPLAKRVERGELTLLSPRECLEELKILVENLDMSNCLFRSNHASNYLAVGGRLPQEQGKMLLGIERALKDQRLLKPETFRGL